MRAWLNEAERALTANRDWLAAEQARQKDAADTLAKGVEALIGA